MTTIDAIYENGVFRPLVPVSIPDRQKVGLTIHESTDDPLADLVDENAYASLPDYGGEIPSIEKVRQALSGIQGNMSDAVIAEREERF